MAKKKKQKNPELKESVNKVWLAGLGALSAAEEEGQKWLKTLIDKGEKYQKKGQTKFDEVRDRIEDASEKAKKRAGGTMNVVEEKVDEMVTGALRRTGVPTREEIATLTKRVEELTRMVEKLEPSRPAARKPAARKPAARKPAASKSTATKSAPKTTAAAKPTSSKS